MRGTGSRDGSGAVLRFSASLWFSLMTRSIRPSWWQGLLREGLTNIIAVIFRMATQVEDAIVERNSEGGVQAAWRYNACLESSKRTRSLGVQGP